MKKKALILGAALAAISFFAIKNHKKSQQNWLTLDQIEINEELHMIRGNCIEGAVLGEMEVYLSEHIDISHLKDGMRIRVLGGPGMTLSLPPQLMNCTKIEIISKNAQE